MTIVLLIFASLLVRIVVNRISKQMQKRRRDADIHSELPLFLEMVAASRQSGRPLEETLRSLRDALRSPIAQLAARTSRRIELGEPLSAALSTEARRLKLPEALVAAAELLERGDRLGVPVAASLLALAHEYRERRQAALTRRIGRAGPVAALVTAMVIAPASAALLMVALVGGAILRGGTLLGMGAH